MYQIPQPFALALNAFQKPGTDQVLRAVPPTPQMSCVRKLQFTSTPLTQMLRVLREPGM
jgi:hypothetical protein